MKKQRLKREFSHFHIQVVFVFQLFFVACTLSAQQFGGGLMTGITGSQIDGDRLAGYTKAGLQIGVTTTRVINDKWTGQIDIKYIQKGANKLTNSLEMDVYNIMLQYAEFPIVCRYKIYKKTEIEMGLAPAILLKSSQNIDGDERIVNPFRKLDIPGVFGVYYFFKPKIAVNIRMSYSLLPIRNHTTSDKYFFNSGQYNNQLCVGIYYFLK